MPRSPPPTSLLGKAVPIVAQMTGAGVSNGLDFQVENPAPTLTSVSPVRANGGGAAFTLTVHGSSFVSNSGVRWNGLARTTTFVSATELQASIPAADIAAGGEFEITVGNPTPAGGVSDPAAFTVTDFTVETTPETRSISAGSSGTFTVDLAPRYGSFDAAVSLRATGLPRGCTASFSPSSVTPGSGTATSTLTLATTARKSSGAGTLAGRGGLLPPGATLLLALAALFAFVRAVPKAPRRRLAPRLAAAVLLVALMLVAAGCSAGGGGGTDEGTPAGTYEITVQGTHGSLEVRDTISLVVN